MSILGFIIYILVLIIIILTILLFEKNNNIIDNSTSNSNTDSSNDNNNSNTDSSNNDDNSTTDYPKTLNHLKFILFIKKYFVFIVILLLGLLFFYNWYFVTARLTLLNNLNLQHPHYVNALRKANSFDFIPAQDQSTFNVSGCIVYEKIPNHRVIARIDRTQLIDLMTRYRMTIPTTITPFEKLVLKEELNKVKYIKKYEFFDFDFNNTLSYNFFLFSNLTVISLLFLTFYFKFVEIHA